VVALNGVHVVEVAGHHEHAVAVWTTVDQVPKQHDLVARLQVHVEQEAAQGVRLPVHVADGPDFSAVVKGGLQARFE